MNLLRLLAPHPWTREQKTAGVVLFLGYLVGAFIAFKLFVSPAVIVPSAGIALAGLVLGGVALWPAVYSAALIATILSGGSLLWIIILPVGYTLEAVAGALLLKRLDFDPLLRRLRDMFVMMCAAFVTSIIVPTFGTLTFFLHAVITHGPPPVVSWSSWWVGHILSLLIVAPFIIRWLAEPYFKRNLFQIVEIVLVFLALIVPTYLLGWTTFVQVGGISLVYFLLVPLFWLAIRIGPRFTILGLVLVTGILVAGAYYAPVAHVGAPIGLRVFQLEIFIIIISVIFYIIAGLQEERTEAIKALRSYIERLEDALNRLSLQDRAKNDFIAILAHELRNPLAPIVSALELLRLTNTKTGEEAEALDLMDDRLKTIQRLLDDLLDVSRISRSKLNLKKEPVDLRKIIDHSMRSIDRSIKQRNQTLHIDIPSEPMILNADPVRIEQVINNLLNNASKFTPEGGTISIMAKHEGKNALVRIRDNGIGIDPDMLGRIFEAFLQLETGQRGEGLGIGLSLTQRLVEMHEGSIEAKSEGSGKGSEFIVRLPLIVAYTATPVSVQERRSAPRNTLSKGPLNILVVDDNISAAHGIGKLLEHKGHKITYAYTGSEAKEKIAAHTPHVVILDIGLPDMDGYDLAHMLRLGLGYTGTLIALTGYGQEEDKLRAYEAGFDHHLTKPVSIADVEAVLSSSS